MGIRKLLRTPIFKIMCERLMSECLLMSVCNVRGIELFIAELFFLPK